MGTPPIQTSKYDRCLNCDRPMVGNGTYGKMSPEERKHFVQHSGRGLCNTCHKRYSRRGKIHHFALINILAGTPYAGDNKKGKKVTHDRE